MMQVFTAHSAPCGSHEPTNHTWLLSTHMCRADQGTEVVVFSPFSSFRHEQQHCQGPLYSGSKSPGKTGLPSSHKPPSHLLCCQDPASRSEA